MTGNGLSKASVACLALAAGAAFAGPVGTVVSEAPAPRLFNRSEMLNNPGALLEWYAEQEAFHKANGLGQFGTAAVLRSSPACPMGTSPLDEGELRCFVGFEDANNGCNFEGVGAPPFNQVELGDCVQGNSGDTGLAGFSIDDDWFQLAVNAPTGVLVTIESNFPVNAGLVEQVVPGGTGAGNPCDNTTGLFDTVVTADNTTGQLSFIINASAAGTYLFAVQNADADVACGDLEYTISWSAAPIPPSDGIDNAIALDNVGSGPLDADTAGSFDQDTFLEGDTVLFVFDNNADSPTFGDVIASNDDDPTSGGVTSRITDLALAAGDYAIAVSGAGATANPALDFGLNNGTGNLSVTGSINGTPISADIPSGSNQFWTFSLSSSDPITIPAEVQLEDEGICIDPAMVPVGTTNNGCFGDLDGDTLADFVGFDTIEVDGLPVLGTSGIFLSGGAQLDDNDWYEFTVPAPTTIAVTYQGEFAADVGLIAQGEPGVAGCDNASVSPAGGVGLVGTTFNPAPFDPVATIVIDLPAAGTYYLFVDPTQPLTPADVPCGAQYVVSVADAGSPAPTGGEIDQVFTTIPGPDVRISTGNSDFDTGLALYNSSGELVAEDDDGGPGLDSEIIAILPPDDYFLFVTGAPEPFIATGGFSSGFFFDPIDGEFGTTTVTITTAQGAPLASATGTTADGEALVYAFTTTVAGTGFPGPGPDDLLEGEPLENCGSGADDNFNGGCNSTPIVFSEIPISFDPLDPVTSIFATTGTFVGPGGGNFRDTDWFSYSIPTGSTVTLDVSLNSETAMFFGNVVFPGAVEGEIDCLAGALFGDVAEADPLVPASIVLNQTATFDNGSGESDFLIVAVPQVFEGVPCETLFSITITNVIASPGLNNASDAGDVEAPSGMSEVSFNTIGSNVDTAAAVYDSSGNLIASNDDADPTPPSDRASEVLFMGQTGESYTAVVTGFPNIDFPMTLGAPGNEGLQDIIPSSSGFFTGAIQTANESVEIAGALTQGGNQFFTFSLVEGAAFQGCNAADVTEDGMLSFGDVSAFIAAFTEGDVDPVAVDGDASADTTGDGMISFGDVSAFIGAFNSGAGCP